MDNIYFYFMNCFEIELFVKYKMVRNTDSFDCYIIKVDYNLFSDEAHHFAQLNSRLKKMISEREKNGFHSF